MRPRLGYLAMVAMLAALPACGGSGPDDKGASADEAIGAAPADAPPLSFAAPQVRGQNRYWDTIILQNQEGFDGVLSFGRTVPEGEPDRLVVVDRRTGAMAYFSGEADAQATSADLAIAGHALTVMAGDFQGADLAYADFVNNENKCAIQYASIALIAVGALLAAPLVIEGATAALAAAHEAAAGIAMQGLRAFAVEAARAAWASSRFRTLLSLKIAEDGAEAWVLFSKKGQELSAPIRRQLSEVVHARCFGQ